MYNQHWLPDIGRIQIHILWIRDCSWYGERLSCSPTTWPDRVLVCQHSCHWNKRNHMLTLFRQLSIQLHVYIKEMWAYSAHTHLTNTLSGETTYRLVCALVLQIQLSYWYRQIWIIFSVSNCSVSFLECKWHRMFSIEKINWLLLLLIEYHFPCINADDNIPFRPEYVLKILIRL